MYQGTIKLLSVTQKKFNQPDNIDDDYLFSLKTYQEIGGEIIEYSSRLDLPTYESILFSKKVNIPTSLNFNSHKKVETELENFNTMNLKEKISLLLPQPKLIPSCWFLTFGLPHIGLGILSRSLCDQKSNLVFDTGLFNAMKFPPNLDYIRFNRKKNNRNLLRSFLSHNIHKSLIKNKLVFQESLLDYDLYAMLVEEWGEPTAAFSLTTNYDFFKKKYFEKKPP